MLRTTRPALRAARPASDSTSATGISRLFVDNSNAPAGSSRPHSVLGVVFEAQRGEIVR